MKVSGWGEEPDEALISLQVLSTLLCGEQPPLHHSKNRLRTPPMPQLPHPPLLQKARLKTVIQVVPHPGRVDPAPPPSSGAGPPVHAGREDVTVDVHIRPILLQPLPSGYPPIVHRSSLYT